MLKGCHILGKSLCLQCIQYRRSSSIRDLLHRPVSSSHDVAKKGHRVKGWVRSVRANKNLSFVVVNDGSTYESLQIVAPKADTAIQGKLTHGASVEIVGTLQANPNPAQPMDMRATSITVLGTASTDFALQKKYTSAEHLREHAHLRPRTRFNSSLLRIQSKLLHSLATFFDSQQIFQVLPPIVTTSDCEGAGETFAISSSADFFGRQTGLIVSSQLHLEALAAGLGRVWTIIPTFRAERSTTARHLAEFRMVEAELCFTESLDAIMDVVEAMIRHLTSTVVEDAEVRHLRTLRAENNDQELDIQARWTSILGAPWIRIPYDMAIKVLQEAFESRKIDVQPKYDAGLGAEQERYLARHFGGPVFVTNYPANQKPFYMLSGINGTVECFDLLVPSMGELCGGSLRDHDLESLLGKMKVTGIDIEAMSWYTDLRRYGSVSHGGFGVGWERLVGYLCGVTNVREIAAFPRWVNHCIA